jgi:S-adenosylmethionine:diacylglycerol 3-amino-3-carboxypropyl transferase
MTDGTVRHIAELELPFGRRAMLREVTHESGLRMLRLILREGTRITQVDIDEKTALALGKLLIENAEHTDAMDGGD